MRQYLSAALAALCLMFSASPSQAQTANHCVAKTTVHFVALQGTQVKFFMEYYYDRVDSSVDQKSDIFTKTYGNPSALPVTAANTVKVAAWLLGNGPGTHFTEERYLACQGFSYTVDDNALKSLYGSDGCTAGMHLSVTQNKCVKDAVCSFPGVVSADKESCVCASGYTLTGGMCLINCTPPQVRDDTKNTCVSCTAGYSYNSAQKKCVKDTTCASGNHFSATQTKCVKDAVCIFPGVVSSDKESCVCASGYTMNGGICKKNVTCSYPGVVAPDGRSCVCADGWTLIRGGSCAKNAVCTAPKVRDPVTNTCIQERGVCTHPKILNPQTNSCDCPSGQIPAANGSCVARCLDPAIPSLINSCACQPQFSTQLKLQPTIPGQFTCVCKDGTTFVKGQGCMGNNPNECPAGQSQSGSTCVCDDAHAKEPSCNTCESGYHPKLVCGSGGSGGSGACVTQCEKDAVCNAPAIPKGEGCSCPLANSTITGGNSCACVFGYNMQSGKCVKNVTSCDPGYHVENGVCAKNFECALPATSASGGTSCVCPANAQLSNDKHTCTCKSGFKLSTDKKECVFDTGSCVAPARATVDRNGNGSCACGPNSSGSNGRCSCNTGYFLKDGMCQFDQTINFKSTTSCYLSGGQSGGQLNCTVRFDTLSFRGIGSMSLGSYSLKRALNGATTIAGVACVLREEAAFTNLSGNAKATLDYGIELYRQRGPNDVISYTSLKHLGETVKFYNGRDLVTATCPDVIRHYY